MDTSDMTRQKHVHALGHRPYPVVHEVCHDQQVDYLGQQEAVAHVLGQRTMRPGPVVRVQLSVREHPEYYREHS